ncbi:Blastomyces yeast-phase-specific protein, partial [Metarhizium majus ARSEF 297]
MLGQAKILALTFATAGTVSAVGNAVVKNNCDFPVTVWSVGREISDPNTIPTGHAYREQFSRDPKSGGRALKTIFAYNLKDGTVWYDLSDVFGDAFAGRKLVEASADASCPRIEWSNGIPPAGSQVKNCRDSADVTLTLCSN